jgi:hypothetical protein
VYALSGIILAQDDNPFGLCLATVLFAKRVDVSGDLRK